MDDKPNDYSINLGYDETVFEENDDSTIVYEPVFGQQLFTKLDIEK